MAREFTPLFSKVGKVFIALVALSMLLQHFGVNVASLVVSLGVGSLAVGLAAQDTLANMFAGFTILLDQPFRVGDRIQLATGETGDVQSIGMRATTIKTGRRDDPDRAQQPAREGAAGEPEPAHAAHRHPGRGRRGLRQRPREGEGRAAPRRPAARPTSIADREPAVLITRFAESAVNFQVMFWARDYADQGLARSEVYEAVHDGLAAAGIAIPLPTRRIIQETIQD